MAARFFRISWTSYRAIALVALASAVHAGAARAQDVRIHGAARDSASTIAREILDRGGYTLVDRDTTLGPASRVEGDLVIVRATVRLAGHVAGSMAVLGGEVFIRPGAVVEGPIAVVGGAVYPSTLATTGATYTTPADVAVSLSREGGTHSVGLTGPPPPRRIRPTGMFGIAAPLYDRVNGLTVGVGTRLLLGGSDRGTFARVAVSYSTHRQALGGSAGLEVPLGRTTWLIAHAARRAATNEEWIRGPLANSLAAVTLGSDAWDHYETDEASLTLARRQAQPLVQGESFLAPRITVRVSDDRSLITGDPWKISGDAWRANPAIAEGTLASVIAGAAFAWRGTTTTFDGDAAVELASPEFGDFGFVHLVAEGRWGMRALWNHRVDLRARTALPLGADAAPPQRWSFVGGPGTLPTLSFGELRGDHVVFLRADYSVPLRAVRVPLLGEPILRASQVTGSAWATGEPAPRWDQNLGAGVAFPLFEAMIWVDPAGPSPTPVLALGLTLPL